MKIAFYYGILFLFLLVLQFSFLNILFSFISIPLVLLIAGVIWTLRLGFHQALWLLIPLLFFCAGDFFCVCSELSFKESAFRKCVSLYDGV